MKYLLSFCMPVVLLAASHVCGHQGQHEQLDQATRQIEHQPDSQELYRRRGRIYAEMDSFEEAQADFDRAALIGPAAPVAFDFAMLCFEKGDLVCALNYMNDYIQAFPGHAGAYEYRARIHRQRSDYPAAVADLNRYMELNESTSPGHYVSASKMYEEMGEAERGLVVLDQGLARLGQVPQLQRRAIQIELSLGNVSEAVDRWRLCREVLGDSAEWKVDMAKLLLEDGRPEESRNLLVSAQTQLQTLRPTPARLRTGEEVRSLLQQVELAE